MSKNLFELGGSVVAAGVALVLWASLAPGQQPTLPFYQPTPGTGAGSQPPAQTQGTARITASPNNVPVPVQNSTYYNNVVAPVGGYYPGYGPNGGYMTGKANLVNASGQFMIDTQQAALLQQQATQSQVDTRNKIIQQRMYEDSITPNSEDLRMKQMMQNLRHSRNNPAPAEIWSGDALNSLYTAVQSAQLQGIQGPSVELPPDALKHINLAQAGKINAGLGLLRDAGKFDWPLILQDDAFKKDREHLELVTPAAIVQATMGKVDAKTLRDLLATEQHMEGTFKGLVQDAAPDQYMEGKKYLYALSGSLRLLQDPAIGNFFNKFAPRGRTVAELVQHMSTNGLNFAAAMPGDESYYQAVYQSFLSYDTGISQLVARQSPPQ